MSELALMCLLALGQAPSPQQPAKAPPAPVQAPSPPPPAVREPEPAAEPAPQRVRERVIEREVPTAPRERVVERVIEREVPAPVRERVIEREVPAPVRERVIEREVAAPAPRYAEAEEPELLLVPPGHLERLVGVIGEKLRRRGLPRVDVAIERTPVYRLRPAATPVQYAAPAPVQFVAPAPAAYRPRHHLGRILPVLPAAPRYYAAEPPPAPRYYPPVAAPTPQGP